MKWIYIGRQNPQPLHKLSEMEWQQNERLTVVATLLQLKRTSKCMVCGATALEKIGQQVLTGWVGENRSRKHSRNLCKRLSSLLSSLLRVKRYCEMKNWLIYTPPSIHSRKILRIREKGGASSIYEKLQLVLVERMLNNDYSFFMTMKIEGEGQGTAQEAFSRC